jgi:hypothetical protein
MCAQHEVFWRKTMNPNPYERAKEILLKAEHTYEIYPEFDCGLMVVRDKLNDEPELREAVVKQLLKEGKHIREILEGRARVKRAKELVGQYVWLLLEGEPMRECTLRAADDSQLTVETTVGTEGAKTQFIVRDFERLIILLPKEEGAGADADAAATADVATADAKVEKSMRRKIFEAFGGKEL